MENPQIKVIVTGVTGMVGEGEGEDGVYFGRISESDDRGGCLSDREEDD